MADEPTDAMANGNKVASFFSDLCDPLSKRKGIAISRLSEVQLLNGAKADEPTDAMARSANDQPKEVRNKLKNYDLMHAQVLIPNRESSISNKALYNLAKAMAAGNKSTAFFNELTDPSLEKRS